MIPNMQKNWRDLIKPRALEVESGSGNFARFVARPLEHGYGTTLGNSLRRVLLSSLQGTAITAIRLNGVQHEFSTMPDVVEDVTEIILNLKELRLKMLSTSAVVTVTIDKEGESVVRASDISTGGHVEILNPEHKICTLGKEGRFKCEMLVKTGRGFVPSEDNKSEDLPLGWIAIDSIFSPVKKVNYTVTQARVGQRTDYDKLQLEVWTDGSVRPEDAVALSSKILRDQMTVFLNFQEEEEPLPEERSAKLESFNPNLYRTVDELELSVRSANCLQNANIKYIYELVGKTEAEMLRTKNFGRKSLNEIKEILQSMGLHLGMKLDGFVAPANTGAPSNPAPRIETDDLPGDGEDDDLDDDLGDDDLE